MGEDIALHADRRDQVPQHAGRRRRHHRRRLRHRGPGRPLRPERISRGWSSASASRSQRADGAVRRDRRLPGRRRRPDGRKVMLLYTDGGDTRSSLRLQRAARSAEGVRRDGLCHRRPRASVARRRGIEQRSMLQQIAETTGGQAFFPVGQGARPGVREGRWPRSARSTRWAICRPTRRPTAPGARSRSRSARKNGRGLPRPLPQRVLRPVQAYKPLDRLKSSHGSDSPIARSERP